ncbi:MAG: bifunctional glutamate N-acetyltransferase/amino-acid acetyltransferase ArgJ [Candidatus Omnitrophica bacterium]|nr:bifunctional glutamate N-acetyltransferase/amino-acid acetyltransferase ArgJ [Candidatus Omnitrophota bacterium]
MKLPQGFLSSGINCGLKRKKLDLGLIYVEDFAKVAGFFTTNANLSYSVVAAKKNIKNPIKAVLVNSGNANCYSHKSGLKDTEDIVLKLAKKLGVKQSSILIASTGIIGKKLPKQKIISGLEPLIKNLGKQSKNFSESILTTDAFVKTAGKQILKGKASVVGFAKGAGMICPNMATMLAFVLTDCDLPQAVFKKIAKEAVEESFNSISVDGCMSTNDTLICLSSGKVPLKNKAQIADFSKSLKVVCLELAKLIVKDAEGASKFIHIRIKGAKTKLEAKKCGLALANSNLFKCAIYGENANWGRIIQSLGQVGVKLGENIGIKTNSLKKRNIDIAIDLKRGRSSASIYTSDLTPQYVKINAEYS